MLHTYRLLNVKLPKSENVANQVLYVVRYNFSSFCSLPQKQMWYVCKWMLYAALFTGCYIMTDRVFITVHVQHSWNEITLLTVKSDRWLLTKLHHCIMPQLTTIKQCFPAVCSLNTYFTRHNISFWRDCNETCHEWSSCEWELLKRFSGSKVRVTKTFAIGGILIDSSPLKTI